MNREQYLAKRMWLHGAASCSGGCAETRHPAGDRGADAPALSLSQHYQRFHHGAAPDKRGSEKPS